MIQIFFFNFLEVVSTCLQNFPRWMENYWNILKDRPINTIFIPGTHDSSSYEGIDHNPLKKITSIKKKPSSAVQVAKHIAQAHPVVNKYAVTQVFLFMFLKSVIHLTPP